MHCLFLTNNPDKIREYQRILHPHGITVHAINLPPTHLYILDTWIRHPVLASTEELNEWIPHHIPRNNLWILRETSYLDLPGFSEPDLPAMAKHISTIHAIRASDAETWSTTKSVQGIYSPQAEESAHGFGWDAQFTVLSTGMTLSEAAAMGIKCSARDISLSAFAQHYLQFSQLRDLNHRPQAPNSVVDFSITPDHILDTTLWSHARHHAILGPMIDHIIMGGIFFRSASNRRDRNYWCPGLNGGIPLTPKKDDVHEATFMFHDLMHHLSPDLIVDRAMDLAHQRVYTVHRMIGEAISLVLADYLFVDHLKRSGIDYDFGKRRIHPVYTALDPDGRAHQDIDTLIHLMWISTQHALLGQSTAMGTQPAVQQYRDKYDTFFIQDYAWTTHNIQDMNRIEDIRQDFSRWGTATPCSNIGLCTIQQFMDRHGLHHNPQWDIPTLVERVFQGIIHDNIRPATTSIPRTPLGPDTIHRNAYRRYMYGQLMVLWTYDHVSGIPAIRTCLYEALANLPDTITHGTIFILQDIYDSAITLIEQAGACTSDDAGTYRGLAPLFTPNFQFYGRPQDAVHSIEEAAMQALEPTPP